MLDTIFPHRTEEHQALAHIALVVLCRVKDGVANRCIGTKVHHGIDVMVPDGLPNKVGIPVVAMHKCCVEACFAMSELQVVVNDNIVSALLKQQGCV